MTVRSVAVAAVPAAILALLVGWLVQVAVADRPFGGAEIGILATTAGFAMFGAVIARHRHGALGWSMLGFAASLAIRLLLEEAALGIEGEGVWVRFAVFGMSALDGVSLALLVRVAILFPTGRPSGRLWSRLLAIMWVLAGVGVALAPFQSYPIGGVTRPSLWPIEGASRLLFLVAVPALLALGIAMGRIVVLRFRGDPVERTQIRWVSYVLGLILLLLIAATVAPSAGDIASVVAGFGIPLAIGVAITRYRLFEIDRIISRTVTYVVVIALLSAVYVAVALGPTLAIGSGDAPSWLVALGTLAAAMLFRPSSRRVQHAVDRRFNRARYDAELLVEGFGDRMRQETDSEEIGRAWATEVAQVLQPAHVSAWTTGGDPQ